MASQPLDDKTLEKLIRMGVPGFEQDWVDRTMEHLNSIPPLQSSPAKQPDPAALKYSVLVQYVQYRGRLMHVAKPTVEPFVMPEDPAKKMAAELTAALQKQLIEEKLMQPVPNARSGAARFKLTELGRRFVADYEREHKTGK